MKDNKLGDIISRLRKEKGLTQKDLADVLHVSDKAISRWETGKSSPNLETIYEISKFFQITFKDLLEARVNDNADENLVQEIINEFTEINTKNAKRIKQVLIATLIIIVILIIAIIFIHTFNRFKVYKVGLENIEFIPVNGVYVETNIKDTLVLGTIALRNNEIKTTDIVSIDLYYTENDKNNIIYTFTSLDNIHLDSYQSYIKIDDLSDYFDRLYLKLTIINEKNEINTYETKLKFTKDFSNNTLYVENSENLKETKKSAKSSKEIQAILIKNNYEQINENVFIKSEKDYTITYLANLNKLIYSKETQKLNYKYTYYLESDILDVYIFDNKNNLEVENYKYDNEKGEVLNCVTGSCNNYKEIIKLLSKNVLYLFE